MKQILSPILIFIVNAIIFTALFLKHFGENKGGNAFWVPKPHSKEMMLSKKKKINNKNAYCKSLNSQKILSVNIL